MKTLLLTILLLSAALVYGQRPTQSDFLGFRAVDPVRCSRIGLRYFNTFTGVTKVCTSVSGSGTWSPILVNGASYGHLIDPAYVPLAGALNADNLFSVASNDNVQNNAGVITTSNHFVGSAFDLKITASGADKWYYGMYNAIRVGGSYTGSNGYIYGIYNSVNNRLNVTATPRVYGISSSINLEGSALEAVAGDFASYRGSSNTNPKFVGIRSQAANAYSDATEITAGEFWARTINPSFAPTATLLRSIWAHQSYVAGTVVTARGLDISGWTTTNTTVNNTAAVYIDNSSNIGVTSNYAIQSDSTAPSYFTGNVSVSGTGKFYVTTPQTPASSSAACTTGQLAWDTGFVYVCVGTNTWKRSALTTW